MFSCIKHLFGNLFSSNHAKIDAMEKEISLLRKQIQSLQETIHAEEELVRQAPITKEERVLRFLEQPHTTKEVSQYLAESRTWTSLMLNRMERNNLIKPVSRTTKGIFYQNIKFSAV